MLVQINTDKNIEGHKRMNDFFEEEVKKDLGRFDDLVTRVEVHLEDENGDKAGKNDKKCVIEARIEKKNPIAVTSHGDTPEKAFYEALHKLKRTLTTEKEKIKAH
jgi:ribosome-associated translation inhibitor RaiA